MLNRLSHAELLADADSDRAAEAQTLLEPGVNCCHVGQASHASVLVDYANFYRALYEAICKAEHSIFMLGWDIDSRIRLLRGEEAAQATCPVRFFDLIRWKARQKPELGIYLNRWNYAPHLALEREAFARLKWWLGTPRNVRFRMDGQVPLGACHHQKIVVIDDEVAFCGGMDVAQWRWDRRSHRPRNKNRVDPRGTYRSGFKRFDPYHDTHMVVSGPIVHCFAELARQRWRRAGGISELPPIRAGSTPEGALPAAWPNSAPLHFSDVPVGVALTQPAHRGQSAVLQVKQLYLDMIARAEDFIYMENQYFCESEIAEALNRQLHAKPRLRLLLVGSRDPEGIMERKAMWHGRLCFMETLRRGGVGHRVAMAYPLSSMNGAQKAVHIHSKLMIVDDRYLRIGSSNLNSRSMGVDTECDLVLEAREEVTRRKIAAIRADLIREHTERGLGEIEQMIAGGENVQRFLEEVPGSGHYLHAVDDGPYRHERFTWLSAVIADPRSPFFQWGQK